jgi:hypothetical protein
VLKVCEINCDTPFSGNPHVHPNSRLQMSSRRGDITVSR